MANKKLSVFTIAATYIGTVVGAGFASGQEVLQFFGYFGFWGIIGLLITTVLLVLFGYIILELGRRLKAESHLEVIRYAGGKWVGTIIDLVITFFLFGGFVAMAAGSGALIMEQFNFPFFWGSLLMIIITLFTVLIGFTGVITSISFVVPLLLTAVFSVAIYVIAVDYTALFTAIRNFSSPGEASVPFWPLSSLLYVSYNLVLAVAILAPLGAMSDKSKLRTGAILGGIGLGFGASAINLALLVKINRATAFEIPMIYIAGTISPLVQIIYTIVLLAEIYTTAVGSLYGFVARLSKAGTAKYRVISITSSVLTFALAQFGFSTLVGTLFPAVGFAGLLLLGTLIYGMFINKEKTAPETAFVKSHFKEAAVFETSRELIDSNDKKKDK